MSGSVLAGRRIPGFALGRRDGEVAWKGHGHNAFTVGRDVDQHDRVRAGARRVVGGARAHVGVLADAAVDADDQEVLVAELGVGIDDVARVEVQRRRPCSGCGSWSTATATPHRSAPAPARRSARRPHGRRPSPCAGSDGAGFGCVGGGAPSIRWVAQAGAAAADRTGTSEACAGSESMTSVAGSSSMRVDGRSVRHRGGEADDASAPCAGSGDSLSGGRGARDLGDQIGDGDAVGVVARAARRRRERTARRLTSPLPRRGAWRRLWSSGKPVIVVTRRTRGSAAGSGVVAVTHVLPASDSQGVSRAVGFGIPGTGFDSCSCSCSSTMWDSATRSPFDEASSY